MELHRPVDTRRDDGIVRENGICDETLDSRGEIWSKVMTGKETTPSTRAYRTKFLVMVSNQEEIWFCCWYHYISATHLRFVM
jgi:hypothetical protein